MSLVLLIVGGIVHVAVLEIATPSAFVTFLLGCAVVCATQMAIKRYRLARIVQRRIFTLEQRISELNAPFALNIQVVESTFETLGFMLEINPHLLYPGDSIKLLSSVSFSSPLRFEPVLGLALRMKLVLTDSEIDRIGDRLYEHAKTVRDVVLILSEEFHPLIQEPSQ